STADSSGPGTWVSDKNDGTDTLYHFTVRAAATTPGASVASVRVQVEPPGAVAFVTVGNAIQVGTTDTWELKWNLTGSGISGNGSVRALIIDSNGEAVVVPSADGQSVHFNKD